MMGEPEPMLGYHQLSRDEVDELYRRLLERADEPERKLLIELQQAVPYGEGLDDLARWSQVEFEMYEQWLSIITLGGYVGFDLGLKAALHAYLIWAVRDLEHGGNGGTDPRWFHELAEL